ncbi:MAG: hypothetical protein JXA54_14005 [Candidatus Heimdallarchaeota archaeon]|nr:hypothetical protein [Candidatus Heimdallarchaeota archaeon]
MSQSITSTIEELNNTTQFNVELLNHLAFHYGIVRTKKIVDSLKTYPTTYPIRVNTQITTREKLITSLNEKNIPAKEHPELEECLLVDVQGPINLVKKEKSIILNYNNSTNNLPIGANLGAKDFTTEDNLAVGDEVSILDKKGEIYAYGIVMMNLEDIAKNEKGIAIKTIESKYKIPNFKIVKEFLRGQFIHQTIPSILIGQQINLKPKDRILDLTPENGEILSHIWQRNAHIESKIIAIHSSPNQFERFQETIKRLRMYKAPIEHFHLKLVKFSERFNRPDTFDWIILQPPSTDLGIRPKIFADISEKLIFNYEKIQKKFVKEAVRVLKHNGTLFYLTNSIDPIENENIIRYATEGLGLQIVKQNIELGSKCTTEISNGNKLQYFFPDVHNTHGQFVAKLTK